MCFRPSNSAVLSWWQPYPTNPNIACCTFWRSLKLLQFNLKGTWRFVQNCRAVKPIFVRISLKTTSVNHMIKACAVHPLGSTNVCKKFSCNLSNNCWDTVIQYEPNCWTDQLTKQPTNRYSIIAICSAKLLVLLKIQHIMQDRTEQYTEGQIKKGILYLMGHSERTLVQALGEHSHWFCILPMISGTFP